MLTWRAFARDAEFNAWGAVTNGIQISIALKEDATGQVKGTNSIILSIRTRNLSTNGVIFVLDNAIVNSPALSFVVITPSGKKVPPAPKPLLGGSGGVVEVSPNETYEFEVNLKDIYQFDEAGTYKITTELGVCFRGTKPFIVTSKPLLVSANRDK